MVDDFGSAIFFPVPDDFGWHTFTFERPIINPEDSVIGLRVRIFIPNASVAVLDTNSFVYLDAIVPIRP
jgi:hypothetical protein